MGYDAHLAGEDGQGEQHTQYSGCLSAVPRLRAWGLRAKQDLSREKRSNLRADAPSAISPGLSNILTGKKV